jgi:hypothetical protein
MKYVDARRVVRALVVPAALSVATMALGCSGTEAACEPVLDTTASVQPTYKCRDGRTCSDVRPAQADGGVYQVCPGTNGCATLVMSNGASMQGFC